MSNTVLNCRNDLNASASTCYNLNNKNMQLLSWQRILQPLPIDLHAAYAIWAKLANHHAMQASPDTETAARVRQKLCCLKGLSVFSLLIT